MTDYTPFTQSKTFSDFGTHHLYSGKKKKPYLYFFGKLYDK
jgi:hypothetical protein